METFADFLNTVLGDYVPSTITIAGEKIALNGMAGVDWPYIVRALVLIVVIYCLLKMVGGLIWKT